MGTYRPCRKNGRFSARTALSGWNRKAERKEFGGARRNRTDDLFNAIEALSQLSYGPTETAASGGGLNTIGDRR
jgi:hypothetical protein